MKLELSYSIAYAVAIQTPDKPFGVEDYLLYIQLVGYILEDMTKVYKVG